MGMIRLYHRRFLRPHAVQVVAVGHGSFHFALGIGRAGQSSAAGPGEGPIPAVIVGGGVAAAVVGDGVAVVGRQQVPSFRRRRYSGAFRCHRRPSEGFRPRCR